HGHSLEFRINAEDPGRNFMPAPGTITTLDLPGGPGVRVDTGCEAGYTVPQAFDSMIAKLVVTGRTREQALQRSRRALAEFHVGGMPTVIPFHQHVVTDPAFAPTDDTEFTVHTRWIETEFHNTIPPHEGSTATAGPPGERRSAVVEVAGRRIEVTLPAGLGGPAGTAPGTSAGAARRRAAGRRPGVPAAGGAALTAPMQGTVVKVAVADGAQVAEGDLVVVLEAMKMEQPILAHRAGTVRGLSADVGAVVSPGAVVCEIGS
ncbi:biotin/lipoyl-containing protein, partial [Marinactinospora rubrisoli]